MTDSDDPPRKKQRAKRNQPDVGAELHQPSKTVELETADLLQLGQSGMVDAGTKTRPLRIDEKVIVDLGPAPAAPPASVIVDLGADPRPVKDAPTRPVVLPAPAPQKRALPVVSKLELPARSSSQIPVPRRGGMGLVVVVYLVAIAALGASIYFRWFA